MIDGEWMETLLVELVETPTELGHEEPGQAIMARAFGECGLEPRDIVLDARALRDHAHASPFTWDVSGKRNLAATWHGTGGGRSLILCGHVDVVLERELNAAPPSPFDAFEHPINLNPGVIAGGDWTSTVAAQCTLSCRLACYPGNDPYELRDRVEAAVARAAGDGFQAAVRYDGFTCEGAAVSPDEPLVEVLSDAYASVHGGRPALEATTATTDARHFVREGIPAVCFGPRAEHIHGIDERVSIASMIDCARVLAAFMTEWCGS